MKTRLAEAATVALGLGLAVFSAFSLAPRSAEATMYTIPVTITEAAALSTCNPNPPPANGGGSATVMYDDVTNMLSWNITFSNLSGAPLAAHFHGPASPSADAGIQVTIADLTSPSVGSMAISEPQEAQLLDGNWYINYHTGMCGGGEIRGQVSGGGVGGVTELTSPEVAPLAETSQSNNNGMFAGIATAFAIAGVAIAGSVLFVGRRLTK